MKLVVSYLPLLKCTGLTGESSSLKSEYYQLLVEIFSESLKNEVFIIDCYQISLISYLHPFFDENQREAFKKWNSLFEKYMLNKVNKQHDELANKKR